MCSHVRGFDPGNGHVAYLVVRFAGAHALPNRFLQKGRPQGVPTIEGSIENMPARLGTRGFPDSPLSCVMRHVPRSGRCILHVSQVLGLG
jgi:hypothetical protein